MKNRDEHEWLDGELSKAIDGHEPRFDAASWSRKYSKEFGVLSGRSQPGAGEEIGGDIMPWILRSHVFRFAAAAVLVVAVVLFVSRPAGDEGPRVTGVAPARPATAMVTGLSLNTAYREGGMEALDAQLEETARMFCSRQEGLSLSDLL